MNIAFPFHISGQGLVAETDPSAHVEQMIEQLLFTIPGERVNRPKFGAGLQRMVFEPAQSELLTATQAMVQAAIQHWLGDVVKVEAIDIQVSNATVMVQLQYVLIQTQQRRSAQFTRGGMR